MTTETHDLLARLLAYPEDATPSALDRCRILVADFPEAVTALDRFAQATASMTTEELQELYTQTFDLNPTCSLELGWQLFGENYARGEFLVAMRQTLRRLGVEESTELPDHLTHVLAALGRMEAAEASRFSAEFLLPALTKMLQGLTAKDIAYTAVLEAIDFVVRGCYPVAPASGESRSWSLPIVDPHEEVCHG